MSTTKVKALLKKAKSNQIVFLCAILLVLTVVITIINPRFLTIMNLSNLLKQVSVMGICAIGVSFVLISGGFDLSVGPLISFMACLLATLINKGLPEGLAILITLCCGGVCGLLNGVLVAKSGCAPVIITLGTEGAFKGCALLIAGGNIINLEGATNFLTTKTVLGIPTVVIMFIVIAALGFLFLRYTVVARRMYAIGGNTEAAYLAGVNVKPTKMLVYTIMGVIAAIASVALLIRISSASAIMGDTYTMDAVAAAVIGGVSIAGGKGNLVGCILGIVLLGVINNAMNILGITAYVQQIIIGGIVITAAIVSEAGNKSSKA